MINIYLVKYPNDKQPILRLLDANPTLSAEINVRDDVCLMQSTTHTSNDDEKIYKHESFDPEGHVTSIKALALMPSIEQISSAGEDSEPCLLQSSGLANIISTLISHPSVTQAQDSIDDLANGFSALALVPPKPKCKTFKYRGKHTPRRAIMHVSLVGPKPCDYSVQLWSLNPTGPRIEFPVLKKSPSKTVAVLRGSRNDDLVASVSGWSEVFGSSHAYVLDNLIWAEKVTALCQVTGHALRTDWRDKGIPGRYNACHAEKQLLAYVFENRRRRVSLHISCEPCDDCHSFIESFAAITKIRVDVFVRGIRVMGV